MFLSKSCQLFIVYSRNRLTVHIAESQRQVTEVVSGSGTARMENDDNEQNMTRWDHTTAKILAISDKSSGYQRFSALLVKVDGHLDIIKKRSNSTPTWLTDINILSISST